MGKIFLKNSITLLFAILFSNSLWAKKAVILVLETPLFRSANIHSKIVQYARKGDLVYINDDQLPQIHITNYIKKEDFYHRSAPPKKLKYKGKFFKTLDKLGRKAYIQRAHVKVIYNDSREFIDEKIPLKYDTTDYRIAEPLRYGYPFTKEKIRSASLGFGLGNQRKVNYPYNQNFVSEKYNLRKAVNLLYLKKEKWDESLRFGWGWNFYFHNETRSFSFLDGRDSYETGYQLGFGPLLSYDVFRTQTHQLTYTFGFVFNWKIVKIEQTKRGFDGSIKYYQGYSLEPKCGVIYIKSVSKEELLNLFLQSELQFNTKHKLTTSEPTTDEKYWNTAAQNYVNIPMGGQITFLLGISSKF